MYINFVIKLVQKSFILSIVFLFIRIFILYRKQAQCDSKTKSSHASKCFVRGKGKACVRQCHPIDRASDSDF